MRTRSLQSFLISFNIHIWGIWLLSLVFMTSRPDPQPQRIEVQLLELPAPLEGSPLASPGLSLNGKSSDQHEKSPATRKPAGAQTGDRPQQSIRQKRGPRVAYRVRIANTASPLETRPAGTWTPASLLGIPRSEVQAQGSRLSGTSPEAERRTLRRAHVVYQPAMSSDQESSTTYSGSAVIVRESSTDHQDSISAAAVLNAHDNYPVSLEDTLGGDNRPLIEIIQARINAVTPLVHATAGPCQTEKGIVRLKFLVNLAGYPCGYRIIDSSGVHCLDSEVDNVLHMAEPYPYVAGWIPVTVRFAPRTRI